MLKNALAQHTMCTHLIFVVQSMCLLGKCMEQNTKKHTKIYKSNKEWTQAGNTCTILQYNSGRMYTVYPSEYICCCCYYCFTYLSYS